MDKPFVSVIIPIYNVEQYIKKCIKSVCDQTFPNIELILVNDGSNDHSVQFAIDTLKENDFMNYRLINQKNAGLGAARNKGIQFANGEWIFFLDSDDTIHIHALEILYSVTTQCYPDLVFGGFQMIKSFSECKDLSEKIQINKYSSGQIQNMFLYRYKRIIAPGVLYRKEWLNKHKLLFSKTKYSEDQHFIWRALVNAELIVEVEAPIYNYLIRPSSIMTSSTIEKILDGYQHMEALSELFINNPKVTPQVKKWMLSRWVLGALRAGTQMFDWKDFCILANRLSYQKNCRELVSFPDKKVRVLSRIAIKKLKIYYKIFNWVGLR